MQSMRGRIGSVNPPSRLALTCLFSGVMFGLAPPSRFPEPCLVGAVPSCRGSRTISDRFLIYGATGFSGRLTLERALSRGLRPMLAGRNAGTLEALAAPHGLEWQAVTLAQKQRLRDVVSGAAVVLNTAGPFAATARPLVDACLATGAHYLDITGEVPVVETMTGRDEEARSRGVMLMPAVGFDVVPSDCLAAHVVRRLPEATLLRFGVDVSSSLSLGSMLTSFSQADDGIPIRRDGRLMTIPPLTATHLFDFGHGPEQALAVSLCDVATAPRSTGVASVEAYMRGSLRLWAALTATRTWGPLLASPIWRTAVASQASWFAPGPSEQARQEGTAVIVVEATDARGRRACSRLRTPEVYTMTAHTAVAVVERVLGGAARPGFQTPSRVFGPDFVLGLDGVSRQDI